MMTQGRIARRTRTVGLAACLSIAALAPSAVRAGDAPGAGPAGPHRVVEQEGFRVTLDLGPQKLAVSMPRDTSYEPEGGTHVLARLPPAVAKGWILSASVLAMKAKQFDDGLYAAVELAAQQGAGTLGGKKALLAALAAALERGEPGPAASVVLAARGLGDPGAPPPAGPHAAGVAAALAGFEKDPLASKPIGFYTWSPALSAIFRQDRMLQRKLEDAAGISAIARALRADPKLRESYEGHLRLAERLTNPLVAGMPDLRDLVAQEKVPVPRDGAYFLPPSAARETELVKRLFGNRPIPEGFSLVDALAKAVREKAVSLAPGADSGWYDHQCWALETLIAPERAPEAAKLVLDDEYRKHLYELYRGILALTRETHVRQLESPPAAGEAPFSPGPVQIEVRPALTAEPLAEFYRRRAASYRFVLGILEDALGKDGLGKIRRLAAVGPVATPLGEEILSMERLFLGAAQETDRELGLREEQGALAAERARALRAFVEGLANDPDVGRDARMMVPLFHDLGREKTKVLAFLGWRTRAVSVRFAEEPAVASITGPDGKPAGPDKAVVRFHEHDTYVVYPVTAEVYVTKILSREEMRALCDAKKTKEAIVRALEE